MLECPTCGASNNDGDWRCGQCGKDLVGVDDDDDSGAAPPVAVPDGGFPDDEPHIADCRDCDFREEYRGNDRQLAREQAEQAVVGHTLHNDHTADVYPADPVVPDEIYYPSSGNARRTLHCEPDCRLLTQAVRVGTAPSTHPPRGTVCRRCGRGLQRSDLVEQDADQDSPPVATDGGSDVYTSAIDWSEIPCPECGEQPILVEHGTLAVCDNEDCSTDRYDIEAGSKQSGGDE